MKRKCKVRRLPSSEYYKSTNSLSVITREQATDVSRYLNSYKDQLLTPDDVLSNTKNYIHVTHSEDPEIVVGAAQLKRRDWKRCSVNSIVVNEKYRKQGYGKRLLEKAEEKAGYREFKVIDALVDDDNDSAKLLLEKYGFKQKLVFYDSQVKKNISSWEKDVKRPERKKKVPTLIL